MECVSRTTRCSEIKLPVCIASGIAYGKVAKRVLGNNRIGSQIESVKNSLQKRHRDSEYWHFKVWCFEGDQRQVVVKTEAGIARSYCALRGMVQWKNKTWCALGGDKHRSEVLVWVEVEDWDQSRNEGGDLWEENASVRSEEGEGCPSGSFFWLCGIL